MILRRFSLPASCRSKFKVTAMKNLVLPIATAVLASGCGSSPSHHFERTGASALRNQPVGYTVHAAPRFNSLSTAQSFTKSVKEAAGSAMAATGLIRNTAPAPASEGDAGDDAAKLGHIVDPAIAITQELLATLEIRNGIKPVPGGLLVADGVKPADIAYASRGRARFMLDVETVEWGLSTFSIDWFHYQLHYEAKARLIDVASGAVVATGVCKDVPDDKDSAPNFDQLMINNAALLKEKLAVATRECIATLKSGMLRW